MQVQISKGITTLRLTKRERDHLAQALNVTACLQRLPVNEARFVNPAAAATKGLTELIVSLSEEEAHA